MQNREVNIRAFQEIIWDYYRIYGRFFPWRNVDDPYKVLVSEIMLQQTQTHRVLPKYELFLQEFSTCDVLAKATLKDVLTFWQGLGYNRRGMFLHKTAQLIEKDFNGIIPNDPKILVTFPGIGPATAASICAFAYNVPTIFIETNIRTVFIQYFFHEKKLVHDKELFPLVAQSLDYENPREWYYALMDYGVMLKQTIGNFSRKSVHHGKQSKFEGSDRQIRGAIIKLLTSQTIVTKEQLITLLQKDPMRVEKIIAQLLSEKLISNKDNILSIS